MPHNISKIKLNKFSVFSICSTKFGYGHYNRTKNLISILKNKKNRIDHYSYGDKFKNKDSFLDKLDYEVRNKNKVILDLTNKLFLDQNTTLKIKKILSVKHNQNVYIIDEPTNKNLSIILNIDNIKTLIPYEVDKKLKKKLKKIKRVKIGFDYFIYPTNKVKKTKKVYDITLSFGGSDNYEGTFYVLRLLEKLKINKKIGVVIGKYNKPFYKKKIFSICKKNNFKIVEFTKNFYNILNKSKLLITNSGLTKYEGIIHGIPIIVFSDSKESQIIDKVFINKTRQYHFSYLKNQQNDILRFKNIITKQKKPKLFDKNFNKSYINKIRFFFDR